MRSPLVPLLLAALLGAGEAPLPPAPEGYAPADAGATVPAALPARPRPNIILLIGDGMGFNQIATLRNCLPPGSRLSLDLLPVAGVALTASADNPVTDSAAAGTAIATGTKTRNGAIGVDADGRDLVTILEAARGQGWRTGLVVTKNVTDATPAAFVAEVASRRSEAEIAVQLLAERVDVVFGGGRGQFLPKAAGGVRTDDLDLLAQARADGVAVALDATALRDLDRLPALGLFSNGLLTTGTADQPSLPEMTTKALELLASADQPFLLMVEGSQIDTAGHRNDPVYLVRELARFDLAVRIACAFAAARQDTLVVVTADHETGGLVPLRDRLHFATGDHSAAPVPVFAAGAGAAAFAGVMDNTDLSARLAAAAGLAPFPRLAQ